MKNLLSIIMLLSIATISFSQKKKKETFQFEDVAGKRVAEKDAKSFTRVLRVNDTCWQFQHYEMAGPLASCKEYKDNEAKVLHGRSAFMRADGTLDSTGNFIDGKPDGNWLYFDSIGTLATQKKYSLGDLLTTWTVGDKNENGPDVEAQFPGSNGWMKYLLPNLRYPQYAMGQRIQGNVIVYFQIDQDGRVLHAMLLKSVEYTLDNEALRIVKESPRWIAATKNGQKITSYKALGVMFKLQ